MDIDIEKLLHWIWTDVWVDSDIVNEMHPEYIKELIGFTETEYKALIALKITYFLLDKKYIEDYDVRDTYNYILGFREE